MKTSRNMAYYPPELVDRIRLIKQLQEERFMPLRVIRELIESADGDVERVRAIADTGGGLVAHGARAGAPADPGERGARALRDSRARARPARRARSAEPRRSHGYSPTDVRIVEAISRFRDAGLEREDGLRRPRRRPPDAGPRAGDRRRAAPAGRALLGARRRARIRPGRGRRRAVPGADRRPAREAAHRRRSRNGSSPASHRPRRRARRGPARARSPARSRARREPWRSRSCTPARKPRRRTG